MLVARGFRLRGIAANRPVLHRSACRARSRPGARSHHVAGGSSCAANPKPKYERRNRGMESNKREYARPKPQSDLLEPLYD